MPESVILLPPSEGKAEGGRARGRRKAPRSFPPLTAARAEVAQALATAMDDEAGAGALLGVKGEALAAAIEANRTLGSGHVLPAIERYTGVLYDNLDAASLDADARARLEAGVLIVSGLWGLVRPTDPIPDYKLKIDASLPPLGRLRTWWRDALTPVLDRSTRDRVVWDLLPNAHAGVWVDPDRTPALRVTTTFEAEQRRDGALVRTSITHWSKALKGTLARHLLATAPPAADPDAVAAALRAFRHAAGYALHDLSPVDSSDVHLHATFVAPAD